MSYIENKHFHRPDGRRRGLSLRGRADARKSRYEAVLFGELLDSWLAVTRLSVKESSFVQYRKLVDNYVRPYLAKLPVCELDRAVLDKHVIFLSAEGRKDRRGGLSPKSVYLTFIRLPNIHTITATFTRLPLTFTRILFWELSGKEQKKQKCPGGN